jgi:hypothetical protein
VVGGDGEAHIQPVVTFGVQPSATVAEPSDGVRRRVPYFRDPALVERWVVWFQNRWLRVVPMTVVWPAARTCRSYRSVS